MSGDEQKPGVEHINLKVVGQDGSLIHFKIKKHTPFRKLMSAYCERTGLAMSDVRFRFDGEPINENETPIQLKLDDGDSIEVFQMQVGGGVFPGEICRSPRVPVHMHKIEQRRLQPLKLPTCVKGKLW